MTQAGLVHVNQSIEAFVYCILEALVFMEDAIRKPDHVNSVQHYQLAVDEAKFWLNLAVCPGALLTLARIIKKTPKALSVTIVG